MKNSNYTLLLIFLLIFAASCSNEPKDKEMISSMYAKMDIEAPVAKKVAQELTIHNDTRIDNYYWLKEREDQEVIDYLTAENTYKDKMMEHTKGFQEDLYQEIIGRIKQDDESVPYFRNGYYYLTRFEEGQEYPIYSRKKKSLEAEEEVMLNVNEMAEGYDYFQIGGLSVSPDNKWLAYGVDTLSRRLYNIHFKNLETGETLDYHIPNASGGATWANDNKTIFYTLKNVETLRTEKIFRHKLNGDTSTDEEVYFEADETFYTGVGKTKDSKYLVIYTGATLTTEFKILSADEPDGQFESFTPRTRGHEYNISHYQDKWLIVTNKDAKNFRLMETADGATNIENWKEVIPHREDVLLESIDVFADFLVIDERKAGLTNLRVINQKSKEEHYLDFGEEAYLAYVSTNPEIDSEWLRYGYQSMTTPNSTFDYNMNTKEKKLLKQQEVVGSFNSDDYETKRLFAEATDGTKVPISLVYKKGLQKNGKNPLLLYGYGSYGATIDPYFSSSRLSLLDRGFVFALAHIRGGQIMGRQWYEDGKLLKKKNTFTDFIDCAEFLIQENYTNKEKLFAMGGSAGGLLMGAVVNMRPDLWKGVVAAVPFVDVITTMLDETIPLTTGEFDEWGNPKDKEYYEYIKSYSPYDNVEAKDYPAMLVTTGLHDSQVQYWEPAKWVAKLREMKTDNNPLVLHTNMEAGHGGASGRFKAQRETAMEYTFLLDLAGLVEEPVKN